MNIRIEKGTEEEMLRSFFKQLKQGIPHPFFIPRLKPGVYDLRVLGYQTLKQAARSEKQDEDDLDWLEEAQKPKGKKPRRRR